MSIEAKTVRPRPTGSVHGEWRERYGDQHLVVTVDPAASTSTEMRVRLERRWGPQIGDNKTQDFALPREGAETLRDALTAALEWTPDQ